MEFNKSQLIYGLLLAIGCSLICAEQLDVSLANANIPGIQSNVPTVIAEPIHVPAADIEKKNTTSTSTTTSTTTTSTTTTTTTAAPTTSSTTSTTTAAPTTTSTPAPPNTTTPAPAPFPDPTIGTWNSSCIMVSMAAQLNFTYETKDNKEKTTLLNIPADAKVFDGSCDGTITQNIHINWGPVDAVNMMVMQFDVKESSVQMTMVSINIPLTSDRFPDAKENQTIQLLHRGFDFTAPNKMSYHCTRPQEFNLTETIAENKVMGKMTVRNVQVQAFLPEKANGFSVAHDCDSSETSDVVPLAVGIALVALIVIVLIAYLCARRRSTSRGYMSF
ncbi:lysosome-associated membrane glycoprotein 1-like [Teleopsis dalmanni]|uniref:lysosome-associated membrane glycoprotein 1-like n=1 Tax=Teleopsis dalmanni TaxID=139649 RepID=UPI0018CDBC70|nr:lysosome-associated membrane glycoprotein 1-like [Teleopsis dalmanni]